MKILSIIYRKPSELSEYKNNTRTHSDEQINQVIDSIKEFGFTNPILIDENDLIIAGHARRQAALRLGLDEVPTIVLTGLSETQKKAYVIADNQLALNAGWDLDLLKIEIEDLAEMDFDVDLLGFDGDFIDKLFDESKGINIDDEIEDVDLDEIIIKFSPDSLISVTNQVDETIKKIPGVTIWYKDEQI